MKCPLFRLAQLLQQREVTWNDIECLKEECGWWNEGLEACSIYLIQEQLALVFGTLRELVDKMPHEMQVRK